MENENEVVGEDVVEIVASKKDIWPAHIESHFICLMEEEVKKGNRQTTTLTKASWRHIKEQLKSNYGKEYTSDQFKNKFNQLRGRWKDFSNLLKMETGLGFTSLAGQLNATNDQWKTLCEKYKFAKQFRKKCCSHYDKLCVIFGDTTASGANQHASTKSTSISDEDDSEGDNDFDQEENGTQTKKKANIGTNNKKRKVRGSAQIAFANALAIMGESAKRKADILKRMSTSHVVGSSSTATGEVNGQSNIVQDKESLMTCLKVLQELEGIDGASFANALRMFKEDPMWRDVFMTLSVERKKDFILNLKLSCV